MKIQFRNNTNWDAFFSNYKNEFTYNYKGNMMSLNRYNKIGNQFDRCNYLYPNAVNRENPITKNERWQFKIIQNQVFLRCHFNEYTLTFA